MSAETRAKILGVLVFLLPLLVVKGAAWFMGGPGPQSAIAATPNHPPIANLGDGLPRPLTERQRAAAAHVAELATKPFGRPPLDYRAPDQATSVPVIQDGGDFKRPTLYPQAKVQIMVESSHDGDSVALIDGRRYREGDTLADWPWIVHEIDGENRCVVLKLVDGEESVRLYIDPQPSGEGQPRQRYP